MVWKRIAIVGLWIVSGAANADWVSQQEVAKWADKVTAVASAYHEECKGVSEPSAFPNFMYRLKAFNDSIRNLKGQLYRGYQYCVPSFRNLRQTYQNLKQEFDANYASHKNFRVRLGWQRVELAFLELDWAFTQGEEL